MCSSKQKIERKISEFNTCSLFLLTSLSTGLSVAADVSTMRTFNNTYTANVTDVSVSNTMTSSFNETTTTPSDVTTPEAHLSVTLTAFYGVIFLLGMIGNVMVISVVWRNKTMRNSTNVYLVNLSVADLSVILVCMPAAMLEFYFEDVWHLGDVMCK